MIEAGSRRALRRDQRDPVLGDGADRRRPRAHPLAGTDDRRHRDREARRAAAGLDARARRRSGSRRGRGGASASPPSARRRSSQAGTDPGVPVGAPGAYQRRNFALARAAAQAYLGALDREAVARGRGGRARAGTPAADRLRAADARRRRPQPRRDPGAGRVAARARRAAITASSRSSRSSTTRMRPGCSPALFGGAVTIDAIVLTSSQNPRALPPGTLQSLTRQLHGPPAEIVADPSRARGARA